MLRRWLASYGHLPTSKGNFDGVAYNSCTNTNDVDLWKDEQEILDFLARRP